MPELRSRVVKRLVLSLVLAFTAFRITSRIYQAELRRLARILDYQNQRFGDWDGQIHKRYMEMTDKSYQLGVEERLIERQRRLFSGELTP